MIGTLKVMTFLKKAWNLVIFFSNNGSSGLVLKETKRLIIVERSCSNDIL